MLARQYISSNIHNIYPTKLLTVYIKMPEMLTGSAPCTCALGKVVTNKIATRGVFWHAPLGQGNFYFFSLIKRGEQEEMSYS